jgi:protein TonB
MPWFWRTLPVSAALHAAVGASLILLPILSKEPLPDRPVNTTPIPIWPTVALVHADERPASVAPRQAGRPRGPSMAAAAPVSRTSAAPPAPNLNAEGPPIDETPGVFGAETTGLGDPGLVGSITGDPNSQGSGVGPGPGALPLRPGGDLQAPRKLRDVAPVYPELARRAGLQGTVVLECVIDPAGHVADVKVLSGHLLLAPAAAEAVRQWLYTPTKLNGVPVAVLLTVTVRFAQPR